jgi:hypothetical protein
LNTHDQVVLTTTQLKNSSFEYNNVYKYEFIVSFGFSIVITRKLVFKRPVKNAAKSKASWTLIR